jgi:hypothetical protein
MMPFSAGAQAGQTNQGTSSPDESGMYFLSFQ